MNPRVELASASLSMAQRIEMAWLWAEWAAQLAPGELPPELHEALALRRHQAQQGLLEDQKSRSPPQSPASWQLPNQSFRELL